MTCEDLIERLRDASLDHNAWRWGWLGEAIDELNRLRAELERERMRLAACGTAALGYFDGCHEDYKSASLDDVLRLAERCKRAEAELATFKAEDDRNQARLELLVERAERAEAGLDALGVAIANAGYLWTPEMREAYEKATNRKG